MQRSLAALCGRVSFQSGFSVGLASLAKLKPNIGNNARGISPVHNKAARYHEINMFGSMSGQPSPTRVPL